MEICRLCFSKNNENYNIKKRDEFFKYYIIHGYKKTVEKYGLIPSFKTKFLKFGAKIKRKIIKKIM